MEFASLCVLLLSAPFFVPEKANRPRIQASRGEWMDVVVWGPPRSGKEQAESQYSEIRAIKALGTIQADLERLGYNRRPSGDLTN